MLALIDENEFVTEVTRHVAERMTRIVTAAGLECSPGTWTPCWPGVDDAAWCTPMLRYRLGYLLAYAKWGHPDRMSEAWVSDLARLALDLYGVTEAEDTPGDMRTVLLAVRCRIKLAAGEPVWIRELMALSGYSKGGLRHALLDQGALKRTKVVEGAPTRANFALSAARTRVWLAERGVPGYMPAEGIALQYACNKRGKTGKILVDLGWTATYYLDRGKPATFDSLFGLMVASDLDHTDLSLERVTLSPGTRSMAPVIAEEIRRLRLDAYVDTQASSPVLCTREARYAANHTFDAAAELGFELVRLAVHQHARRRVPVASAGAETVAPVP
ncbi:MAG: hypothetical protein ABI862_07880 [Ilumatobacteraceae bacterium]